MWSSSSSMLSSSSLSGLARFLEAAFALVAGFAVRVVWVSFLGAALEAVFLGAAFALGFCSHRELVAIEPLGSKERGYVPARARE